MPVYNEDPVTTFARIAAMDASLAAIWTRARCSISRSCPTPATTPIAARERLWFLRLVQERKAEGRIFYRRRAENTGRKAGNIEDFITRSGGGLRLSR